ncbi:MAG: type II toxin-antitoxin system RelE/ParE family toxin, partial [Tepidiformaceae bacterium]
IAYSARAAERFSDRVSAASQRISTFPESGRLIPEFGDPQLREVVVDRYRLWYRLSEGEIEVVTLWPAAVPVDEE